MVWQNPSLLTEDQKVAQEAALAKKVNAPLAASVLHKGNKIWVNPALKEKEGSMDIDSTTPTKAVASQEAPQSPAAEAPLTPA